MFAGGVAISSSAVGLYDCLPVREDMQLGMTRRATKQAQRSPVPRGAIRREGVCGRSGSGWIGPYYCVLEGPGSYGAA